MTDPSDNLKIPLNGEPVALREALTLSGLIDEMGYKSRAIAVELNEEIIPRNEFDRALNAGDRIEVVTLVGGG